MICDLIKLLLYLHNDTRKQKGFLCEKSYNTITGSVITSYNRTDYWENEIPFCSLSLLQTWLREIKNIHIEICYMDDILLYGFKITDIKTNTEFESVFKYNSYTYNSALEAGIIETLNKI